LKVLWITNIPSPYRVDFFNDLGKIVELDVVFERNSSSERDNSWKKNNYRNFTPIFLKGKNIGVDFALSFQILKYIKKDKYDHIVVTNFASPTGIIGITKLNLLNIPYYIESDGGFPSKNNTFKKIIKGFTLKRAQKCLSTSNIHDEYYLENGVKKENIVRYPFSSIKQKDIIKNIEYKNNKKVTLKKKLGIDSEYVVIGVGRFVENKGFEDLLNAFSNFPETYSISLYIIGGEITPSYKKIIIEKNIKRVSFLEFLSKEDLKNMYIAADVFVLPTHSDVWGLVINEAMSNGLPVVTTTKCLAGMEMIKDNENGYLVDIKRSDILYDRIKKIIDNKVLQENMSKNNIEKIKEYTIDSMVEFHKNFFIKEKK